jgi:lysophospholipase L1-like esterase
VFRTSDEHMPGGLRDRAFVLFASCQERSYDQTVTLPVWKQIVFTLIPLCVLFGALEGVVRLAGWDRPALQTLELPEERAGLIQPDRTLFWALKPDMHALWNNTRISINHQGTRGEDIEPKQPRELRILSLGESTTFGTGVNDEETYSAVLEEILQSRYPDRRVTVINAGVPAYSSFQSLKFLEQRGVTFEPDVVLFYHEVNDYLPTSLRDSSNNEIGVMQTDEQLFESRTQGLHRALMEWSGVYRWLSYRLANARIRKFDRPEADNPLLTIGLPGYALPSRIADTAKPGERTGYNDKALGRRVSEDERRANIEKLATWCVSHHVALVLLHPAYRDSTLHECVLTRVAAARAIPLFETFSSLHPTGVGVSDVYLDAWHPRPDGHEWIARDLANFLIDRGLLPTSAR